ncbi:hypothetical protein T01_1633 [Trichinella spiralis]|uniref:Uncharacterized protein n=1 Tax=Trichinella spiralis TaxID=6334 RepID=A0A0V1BUR7_TRISP|nr:hypothetical protein T01_1633 [Trichinella spiralis]
MNYFQIGKAKILSIRVSVVTTRRVGPADLPPGPRQFVRRFYVLVRSRSLGHVSSSTSSEHAFTRTTRPHVGHRSRSSPLQYIEGFRRRGAT